MVQRHSIEKINRCNDISERVSVWGSSKRPKNKLVVDSFIDSYANVAVRNRTFIAVGYEVNDDHHRGFVTQKGHAGDHGSSRLSLYCLQTHR